MAAAWIGLAGGVFAAVLSAVVAVRQSHVDERMALLTHQLSADEQAAAVLRRYREPLAAAAFELQSRLYNVLRLGFFEKFGDGPRAEDAVSSTVFRLAQYFGWTEIMRSDIQFLSFPEADETRRVAQLQYRIGDVFRTDRLPSPMMIWTDEQRAIGERMIVEARGKVLCMGYADFRNSMHETLPWSARICAELDHPEARPRLMEAQHLLCDLVEALDADRVRYTEDLQRA